ncbi:Alpha/beta-hydrolase [Pleurostoma richardsiae]|uniref:Alpha/beta-hydrolase n=1 Tax=Pleurostoma richardsiae TaxID=41990 RepID=A0AA38RXJ9_9PEZI|nr:Alpha/beta-hydrolase [Pleurostoma richardsiae]
MPSPISVNFLSRGISIAGHLYTPHPDAPNRKHAAIVVGHPTSGVKEQAAGLYARLLAEAGFIALTFDAGYQGESGGEPHGLEDPYQRVEDFKSAVTYLSTLDEPQGVRVDAQRIGILGICASGGYVSFAAQTDLRMRAVATVSAGCLGETTRHGIEGSGPSSLVTPELLSSLLKQSGHARISAAKTGEAFLVAMLPETAAGLPNDIPENGALKEGIDYYKTPRGAHPRSTNKEVMWSVDLRANYDSFAFNYMISPRPLLMIAGGDADTAYLSRRGIEKAREPKELYIIPGKTHVDLYDDTSVTLPKLVGFMEKALCQ